MLSQAPDAHTYILATCEAKIRRIMVQGQPGQKARPYLKVPNIKKGWQSGSIGRMLASEFVKPQYCKEKKYIE
jgi:hypothetical protein